MRTDFIDSGKHYNNSDYTCNMALIFSSVRPAVKAARASAALALFVVLIVVAALPLQKYF
jgi:hypothetical protein